MSQFYLVAKDRSDKESLLMFWKPYCRGYTHVIEEAGIYTEEQLKRIPSRSFHEDTFPVPVEKVKELAILGERWGETVLVVRNGEKEREHLGLTDKIEAFPF